MKDGGYNHLGGVGSSMASNFNQLLQQAQQMKDQFQKTQEKMKSMEFIGTSGGGMVSITVNGGGEMTNVHIDPKLMDPNDTEILADLIIAAYSDSKSKLETAMTEQVGNLFGGSGGMKMPFFS